jgi:hypothetical protein
MAFAPLLLAFAVTLPAAAPSGQPAPAPASQASPAPASPAEVREQVRAYLWAIHGSVPPERFRALGPAAVEALADFARTDPSPVRRLRALEALAALGGARAEAVHREVLASPGAPRAVRRGAVRGLARLAGPAGAPSVLGPILEQDRDPAVRAAAAEALASTAPTAGCERVRARSRVDPEPARFGRALEACERASHERTPAR